MRVCTIHGTTLSLRGQLQKLSRAKGLQEKDSSTVLHGIPDTPYRCRSQGKPVAARKSRC